MAPKKFLNGVQFIDGQDSYAEHYRLWSGGVRIVKTVLRVQEVAAADFVRKEPEELLEQFQLTGLEVIDYDGKGDGDGAFNPSEHSQAAGYTITVRVPSSGDYKSVIFIRENVNGFEHLTGVERQEEEARAKLAVLMHEFGHADDLEQLKNFDPRIKVSDQLAAEVYAHQFVILEAKRLNYIGLLNEFIAGLKADLERTDMYGEAARQVLSRLKIRGQRVV